MRVSERNSPLLEGAIHRTYDYQGWRIRGVFVELGAPCIRMEFQKNAGDPRLQDYEVDAILAANVGAGGNLATRDVHESKLPEQGVCEAR